MQYKCNDCGKIFPYNSKLLEHKNRKFPCVKNAQKWTQNAQKGTLECAKCQKSFNRAFCLKRHEKTCNGIKEQCPKCLQIFENARSRAKHERMVNCVKDKTEIQNTTIINNNCSTYNINIISYNHEYQQLETCEEDAPSKYLLCYEGFKNNAFKKDGLLPSCKLIEIVNNILNNNAKDYDTLWKLFFRNIEHKELQLMMLHKNNNTTHANIFRKGTIESINKNFLYKQISSYIAQYILKIDFDYLDIVNLIKDDPDCKTSFFDVIKQDSTTFDYYKKWLCD